MWQIDQIIFATEQNVQKFISVLFQRNKVVSFLWLKVAIKMALDIYLQLARLNAIC